MSYKDELKDSQGKPKNNGNRYIVFCEDKKKLKQTSELQSNCMDNYQKYLGDSPSFLCILHPLTNLK